MSYKSKTSETPSEKLVRDIRHHSQAIFANCPEAFDDGHLTPINSNALGATRSTLIASSSGRCRP